MGVVLREYRAVSNTYYNCFGYSLRSAQTDSKCYKDNTKNIAIIATVLIIGLGTSYLSTYAGINIGIPISKTSSLTGLSLAAIVGVILNRVLNKDEFKNEEDFNLETINN